MNQAGLALEQVVPASAAGERLDRYLSGCLPELSRTRLQRLVLDGAVTVNGRPSKAALRLEAGDRVQVRPPAPAVPDEGGPRAAADLPLAVLYADEALIVVDKVAGMVVHPAAGHRDDTLVNALVAHFPDLVAAFEGRRPGIVHRLDKDTSGVMVVGRTIAAADALMAQFKARQVEKVYLALAKGTVSPAVGRIEAPLARDRLHRQRMAAQAGGRPAETDYRVLEAVPGYSWLEVRPRTGRTHQIRTHLAAIGHPLAGDPIYGRRDRHLPRLALHAWRLAVDHPLSGERLEFTAPLPEDLSQALSDLGFRWQDSG